MGEQPDVAAEFERLLAAATEGPWKPETGAHRCFDEEWDLWYARGPLVKAVGLGAGKAAVKADAEPIAFARNRGPELLSRLRAAERERDVAIEHALEVMASPGGPCGPEAHGRRCEVFAKDAGIPLATVRRAAGLDPTPPP